MTSKKMVIKTNTKRRLGGSVGVVLCLWLLFLGYIDWAMHQPPEVFGHVMAKMPMPAYFLFPFETMWLNARKGTLSVGGAAPNLTVKKLEDKSAVTLASLWTERPVVLVFGSYT
jgi:hypothetical protein